MQLGALAVSIRQTNVIWMLFVACSGVMDLMLVHQRDGVGLQKSDVTTSEKGQITREDDFAVNPGLRRRKMKNTVDIPTAAIPSETNIPSSHLSGLVDEIQFILLQSWHLKWEILVSFSPFFFVLGAFVSFVYWNGSVVLGAKEAHAVSPHFTQMMYFALVSALFSAPFHFTLGRAVSLLRSFWKSRPLSYALLFGAFAAGLLAVHLFSIAHPYLLADNRHYPFYIWRKLIKAHWLMKYLLVPLYIYSWISILGILGKARSRIWVLAYFLACAAVLVPAPLIEFRYYTIPFFIFMLNCGNDETSKWLLTGTLYVVINGFTLWMFLFRPFHWDHEPGVQRFIW